MLRKNWTHAVRDRMYWRANVMATLNDLLSDMQDIQDGVSQILTLVQSLKDQPKDQIPQETQDTINQLHQQATAIEESLKNVTGQESPGSSDTGTTGGEG
jgi:uncharacterized protein involved in exopolysaccharide biosynthesis